jgi:hypothetical protein
VFAIVLAVVLLATTGGVVLAQKDVTGNGAPSGAHYNLNIIGVENPKTADMKDTNGHTIFVNLNKKSKINLCQSGIEGGCAPDDEFVVLDRNGTDGDGALFALPNPDPGKEGCTAYSVYIRALGNPGGKADMTTCAMYWNEETETWEEVCSTEVVELDASARPQKFTNVSKELLTICADLDGDGNYKRYYLFDDELEGYFWEYDNKGLKLAQVRFYMQETCYTESEWNCKGGD